MATIAVLDTRAGTSAIKGVTKTALTGADDFALSRSRVQFLVLENTGAGTPTINIDGDLASTVNCGGLGSPIDVSGGFDVPLTATGSAGAFALVDIGAISAYTTSSTGLPAVTGGTADVLAYIIER